MSEEDMIEEKSPKHPFFNYVAPVILLLVGVGGFLLLSSMKKAPASSRPEQRPPSIRTVTVVRGEDSLLLKADGEVSPYREVNLSAEVAGRIETKMPECRSGRFVRKDAVLMQIDSLDYDLELRRLGEMAEQADISLEEVDVEKANTIELISLAEESLDLQQNELRRIESLFRRKVATESEFDGAKNNELTARNSVQTLRNQNALLVKRRARLLSEQQRIQVELEKAELDRDRTEIRAPISGVIMEDMVEAGAFVQRGTALVKIEDTSKVDVVFNLRMDQLRWLWRYTGGPPQLADAASVGSYELPDLPVAVTMAVGEQKFVWQGRLARYDGAGINTATRTVPCVAIVDDPTQMEIVDGDSRSLDLPAPPALLRGMFVSVGIQVKPRMTLLSLPEGAVRPGNKVWVARDEKLAIESVEVVMTIDGRAMVLANAKGLREGDEVITSPLPVAVDGMQLRMATSDVEKSKRADEKSEED